MAVVVRCSNSIIDRVRQDCPLPDVDPTKTGTTLQSGGRLRLRIGYSLRRDLAFFSRDLWVVGLQNGRSAPLDF